MDIVLLVLDPDGSPFWAKLNEGETTVGRGADNDLVLAGRGVSRHHAALTFDAGVLTVRDLDSTYGTRVRGSAVRRKQVAPGDAVDMGTFRLLPLPAGATSRSACCNLRGRLVGPFRAERSGWPKRRLDD